MYYEYPAKQNLRHAMKDKASLAHDLYFSKNGDLLAKTVPGEAKKFVSKP